MEAAKKARPRSPDKQSQSQSSAGATVMSVAVMSGSMPATSAEPSSGSGEQSAPTPRFLTALQREFKEKCEAMDLENR
eukprot:12877906-Alexandrium_andersonii.AAC.1